MTNQLTNLADVAEHVSCNELNKKTSDAMGEIAALLRSAAAETVGTEWRDYPNNADLSTVVRSHNADLSAARVRIAAVEAERDAAEKRLEALPHTHDGQPIVPGMTLYVANPSDWSRPDLIKDGRPVLTSFTAQDYEVHPHYRQWKMFADRESAKVDAEADRAAALAAKESKQ